MVRKSNYLFVYHIDIKIYDMQLYYFCYLFAW